MKIRDLDSLGPLVASSLRSDATAQGPRLSKSRIFTDSQNNLYIDISICLYNLCSPFVQVSITKYGST